MENENNVERLHQAIQPHEARVNVTFAGANGDLPDPVAFDATDADVKQMLTEALRTGGVPGIPARADANLADFVVDRFPPTDVRPYNLLQLRPKTPFGYAQAKKRSICVFCDLGYPVRVRYG